MGRVNTTPDIRRIDARFLLPTVPSTAAVIGDVPGWRDALVAAGISVVDDPSARVDLVVTRGRPAKSHRARRAGTVLVELPVLSARLRSGVSTWISVPSVDRPEVLVPARHPAAVRYAVEVRATDDRAWKRARNRAAAGLLRPLLPLVRPVVAVGDASPGEPFLLRAARDLGVDTAAAVLTVGGNDDLSRGAFHVLPPGASLPAWVVKFSRVPGYTAPFDADEQGLRAAAAAGGAVARRVPALVGRFEVAGLHASVETAATGRPLGAFLASRAPRSDKLRAVSAVVDWLGQLARETAAAGALDGERVRIRNVVASDWPALPADLVDRLPNIPAVLQHNDVGTWNVIGTAEDFTVVDWESARPHGFPLWDVIYFLADALALVDGAPQADRVEHTLRLFRGETPSSQILFDAVRSLAEVSAVPDSAVGLLAALCWVHHAGSHRVRQTALDVTTGRDATVPAAERVAARWLDDPALGLDWPARR